jgi:hypothetical protein
MKPANRAPIYAACCYPDLAEITRKHGYALAVHGSLARDFDLIAIPWRPYGSSHSDVLDEIIDRFSVEIVGDVEVKGCRDVYTLSWLGEASMDFSFIRFEYPEEPTE